MRTAAAVVVAVAAAAAATVQAWVPALRPMALLQRMRPRHPRRAKRHVSARQAAPAARASQRRRRRRRPRVGWWRGCPCAALPRTAAARARRSRLPDSISESDCGLSPLPFCLR